MSTLFERAGGRPGLERVVRHFYAAMFADPMIGFYFRGQDHERLVAHEVELMAVHFGAPDSAYTGRSLGRAHARHRIFRGHFDRRTVLVREALDACATAPEVRAAWLAHTEALRAEVMSGDCD